MMFRPQDTCDGWFDIREAAAVRAREIESGEARITIHSYHEADRDGAIECGSARLSRRRNSASTYDT